ncbi:MAG: hypothetical protein AAF423_10220 [Pseudomonadota bacterium]
MSKRSNMNKFLGCVVATTAMTLGFQFSSVVAANAQAGIFEVVHPDVKQGEIEIEILNGVSLNSIDDGEERSVHEFAIGYGLTDFWKVTAAVEVANPQGDDPLVEGFEFENLLILFGGGHHHDEGESEVEEEHHDFTLGFFTALEVPKEGGISEGAVEFGPVIETGIGSAEFVGNLFVEVPFADGEDAGLAYASQLIFPVSDGFGFGVENFGEFEGLFGDRGEDVHFAGPAFYWEAELDNGHVIEPRIAVLFGLNNDSPDAVLSFNLEYKIGQQE